MFRRPLLSAAILILVVSSASSVTLRRAHLGEVVRHADAVFAGTVDRQWCERCPERPKLIVTKVAFKDLTVLHGDVKSTELVLTFHGGKLGDSSVLVPGMPTFAEGERVLLAVGLDRKWPCPILGWWQGRFTFVKDDASGPTIVKDGRGKQVGGVSEGRVVLRPGGTAAFSDVDFLREVRALIPAKEEEPDDGGEEDER